MYVCMYVDNAKVLIENSNDLIAFQLSIAIYCVTERVTCFEGFIAIFSSDMREAIKMDITQIKTHEKDTILDSTNRME